MSASNYFAALAAINVNEHVERKNSFTFLSWPYAVSQLRMADPTATWTVCRFNGLPYLATEAGVFVEVAVTVQGITLSQVHPVLHARNRPILAPNAFDLNTSLQRCLVKAIALHGVGLYLFAGEDLPKQLQAEAANDASSDTAVVPTERPGLANITRNQQVQIHKLAVDIGIGLNRFWRTSTSGLWTRYPPPTSSASCARWRTGVKPLDPAARDSSDASRSPTKPFTGDSHEITYTNRNHRPTGTGLALLA